MHKYLLTEAEIIKAANLANLIQEGEELIAIFVTLVKKVKDKGGRGKFKDGRGKAEELKKGEDQEKYRKAKIDLIAKNSFFNLPPSILKVIGKALFQ